jgi:hypothetical protein
MPRGDDTKTLAFELWFKGRTVEEIQRQIAKVSGTKVSGVRAWILDWERGRQRLWTPGSTMDDHGARPCQSLMGTT